jgi:hypothetical protein
VKPSQHLVIFRDYIAVLEDIKLQGENFERERALELIAIIAEAYSEFSQDQRYAMMRVLATAAIAFELDDEAECEIEITREYLAEGN